MDRNFPYFSTRVTTHDRMPGGGGEDIAITNNVETNKQPSKTTLAQPMQTLPIANTHRCLERGGNTQLSPTRAIIYPVLNDGMSLKGKPHSSERKIGCRATSDELKSKV